MTRRPRTRTTKPKAPQAPLLFPREQQVLAAAVLLALVSMASYWFTQGAHQGELIEIDRANPRSATFAVDINHAEWPELTQIPGIGEVIARRIVSSRQEQGPFLDHHDLTRVPGIGPRTLENMEPFLLPMPGAKSVAGQ